MNTEPADSSARFRIFLSRVSSEFEEAATAVASDLRARGLEVKIQEDFRQEADAATTLDKLHNYIRDCDAVVAIIGNRSGAFPPDEAAGEYQSILPSGVTRASYTQWEVHFARHHRKRLSFYDGRGFNGGSSAPGGDDDPSQQASYVQRLFDRLGLDRGNFSTIPELTRLVLREDWPLRKLYQPRNLPYPSLGQLFKGREEFMERVRQAFRSGARAAGIGAVPAIAATHGLGGIGKTRLAVEYALRHAGEYDALLFLSADTPEKLDTSLAGLTGPMVLDLPDQNLPDPEKQKAAVLRWLAAHPRFFLIIDNVDDARAATAARDLIARLPGGDIVITGRINRWFRGVQPLELSVLTTDDASDFLLSAASRRRAEADDAAQSRVIADKLGGLALALEQAAAYINEQRSTFAGYLRDWESHHDAVIEWFDEFASQYPRSVAITWRTSVEKLSPAGRRLLELLAWFAPEPVPERLLDDSATATMNAAYPPVVDGRALSDLARYSLVTREGDAPLFSVHRLVQDVTRRRLEKEGRAAALRQQAIEWMCGAFTGNVHDVIEWSRFDPLAPHAAIIAESAVSCGLGKEAGHLYSFLASWNNSHGRYDVAVEQGRLAASHLQSTLGPEHPDTLSSRMRLASALNYQGKHGEAEKENRTCIAIQARVLGPEHPSTLASRYNLANSLRLQGKHSDAEAEIRAVLAIHEHVLGPEHPTTLDSRNLLAVALRAQGKQSVAESEIRTVLAIQERVLRPEHLDTLGSRNNLANALHAQGKHGEAETEHRAVLTIRENVLGPEHPDVFTSCYNLALSLRDQNKKPEALKFAKRALEGRRKTLGEEHPLTKKVQKLLDALE